MLCNRALAVSLVLLYFLGIVYALSYLRGIGFVAYLKFIFRLAHIGVAALVLFVVSRIKY